MAKSKKGQGARSGGKKQDPLKEAIVLVPLTYNDGARVPEESLEAIRDRIFEAFDGWTIEGTVKGAYRMESGDKQVEDLVKISIILNESRIPELEVMVAEWGASLGQEAMLMKIADFEVRFVPPQPSEEE